jgi:2-polyprenyl-6-hydroxyphenyl methylase/3-demethylubiquinone-9 3-methyltransferase
VLLERRLILLAALFSIKEINWESDNVRKPFERMAEAYFGELGDINFNIARKQVHWLCERSKGENILDVGCSQGITSILLAREGKKVFGLDPSEQSIQYARQLLNYEDSMTKQFVDFNAGHFMVYNFEGKVFDSIILRDVLQTVIDTQRVMHKASKIVKEEGHIIITVPFGLNHTMNQVKLFYLTEIYKLQIDSLQICEINFCDNWIGAVLKKVPSSQPKKINEDEVLKLENAIENFQRGKFSYDIHSESEKSPSDDDTNEQQELLEQEKRVSINSIKKNIYLLEHLEDAYKREEKLLLSYKKLLRKYNALSNSKLGKFTLYYWKKRRSLFGGK